MKNQQKLVYVCSPLRGDIDINIQNAISYSRKVYQAGCIPITPHAYFTLFLNDNKDEERKAGMGMGLQLLSICHELWVFGNKVSYGMAQEIEIAEQLNIPVRRIDKSCRINKYTQEGVWCYDKCAGCAQYKNRVIEEHTTAAQRAETLGVLESTLG